MTRKYNKIQKRTILTKGEYGLSPLREKTVNVVCGQENLWHDLELRNVVPYLRVIRKYQHRQKINK